MPILRQIQIKSDNPSQVPLQEARREGTVQEINALRRDIREIRAMAKAAYEAAGTLLHGGRDDEGWIEVARQYDEQARRLEAVLRALYRR